MTAAVIKATYSDWKLIKTRGVVQMIFEVPLNEADSAYQVVGGMPDAAGERWFAIARLDPEKVKGGEANNRRSISEPDKTPPAPAPDQPARAKSWHDMSPAQQAGMLCAYPAFINFLRAEYNSSIISNADAAVHVRSLCGVDSRADIDKSSAAQMRWRNLVSQYRAWMKEPEVV